jgi:capsular polysaccharide biosynthesis protein
MTTAALWRTLRERWWLLAAGAVIGLIGGLIVNAALPHSYESKGQILVEADAAQAAEVTQSLPTYLELATADSTVTKISKLMGEPMTAADVASSVSVTSPENTSIIEVTAEDEDPATAQKLSSAAATALSENIGDGKDKGVSATVVLKPAVPSSPSSPNPMIIAPVGVVVGLLAGLVAALVLNGRDRRPRRIDDAVDAAEAPVLAVLGSSDHGLAAEAAEEGRPRTMQGLAGAIHGLGAPPGARTTLLGIDGAPVARLAEGLSEEGLAVRTIDLDVDADALVSMRDDEATVLVGAADARVSRFARGAAMARWRGKRLAGVVMLADGPAERLDAVEASGKHKAAEKLPHEGGENDGGRI